MKLQALNPGEGYIFPGRSGRPFEGIQKVWDRVRERSGLKNVRLHDLRHTFISTGVNAGLSLTVMGHVAGHRRTETTARYAHLIVGSANFAAEQVSSSVATAIKASKP